MLKFIQSFTRKKRKYSSSIERKAPTFSRMIRKTNRIGKRKHNGGRGGEASAPAPAAEGGKKTKSNIFYEPIPSPNNMNCSPMVQRSKLQQSCYTPNILELIKTEYNKSHEDTPIEATDSVEIWKELKTRLHCEKEDCWLSQIKNDQLKKQIDRYIFAPDSPPSWDKNPNEWLSNYDILNVLEQYELTYPHFEFLGPSPIDFDTIVNHRCVYRELCKFNLKSYLDKGKTKIGIIFNLDKHTGPGTHWVSLFIDTVDRFLFYFDSNGEKIPAEIANLAKRVEDQAIALDMRLEFYTNRIQHQRSNTECGMYSLFFIITMLLGKTHTKKHLSKKEKLNLFLKKKIPDKYVEQYRNVYFNG